MESKLKPSIDSKELLKQEIVRYLESQLRGAVIPLEDLRRIVSEHTNHEYTLQDVIDASHELYIEGKVTLWVRL